MVCMFMNGGLQFVRQCVRYHVGLLLNGACVCTDDSGNGVPNVRTKASRNYNP